MKRHKLSATVIAIGPVSFFNDLASEMVTPFGWYHLAVGFSVIPAGVLFGAV